MLRVVTRIVGIGLVCALGLCMYFLGATLRLQNTLVRLKGQGGLTAASRIAQERSLVEQGLKVKYGEKLASFGKLAHDLEIERNKAKKLGGYAQNRIHSP